MPIIAPNGHEISTQHTTRVVITILDKPPHTTKPTKLDIGVDLETSKPHVIRRTVDHIANSVLEKLLELRAGGNTRESPRAPHDISDVNTFVPDIRDGG